jgi:phosphatidylglycerophosphate synthase
MLSLRRDAFQPLRRLLAWPFLRLGASAATVGLLGIVLAALAAGAARLNAHLPALALAVLAVLTDMADGEVARRTGTAGPEGNYLDALGDRIGECILLLGLLEASPNLAALSLAGACLTSYAKARCALVLQMDNRDWPGFGEYPDRAVMIVLAYATLPRPGLALGALALASWFCLWGRIRHARRLIRQAPPEELQPYLRGSAAFQR